MVRHRILPTPVILIVTVGMVVIAAWISNSFDLEKGDFFTFWLAGRMIAQGDSPYNEGQWTAYHHQFEITDIANPTYLYPLPLAVIYAPMGLLPPKLAVIIWVFCFQAFLLLSLLTLVTGWPPGHNKHYLIPVAAGVILYRPVIVTLTNTQVVILLLFSLSAVVYFWQRDQWMMGGYFLSLLALKPSIGLPIIAFITFWLVINKRWRAFFGFFPAAVLLSGLGWIGDPVWVQEYISILGRKFETAFGYSPSLWGIGAVLCEHAKPCTFYLGSIFSLLVGVTFLFLLRRYFSHAKIDVLVGAAVCAALLITPYQWAYDHILLIIPIIALVGLMRQLGWPYLFTSTFMLQMSILSILLLFTAMRAGSDAWTGIMPLICGGFLFWIFRMVEKRQSDRLSAGF